MTPNDGQVASRAVWARPSPFSLPLCDAQGKTGLGLAAILRPVDEVTRPKLMSGTAVKLVGVWLALLAGERRWSKWFCQNLMISTDGKVVGRSKLKVKRRWDCRGRLTVTEGNVDNRPVQKTSRTVTTRAATRVVGDNWQQLCEDTRCRKLQFPVALSVEAQKKLDSRTNACLLLLSRNSLVNNLWEFCTYWLIIVNTTRLL